MNEGENQPQFYSGNSDELSATARPTPAAPATELDSEIRWTASEFIEHQKNAGWYMLLLIAGAALSAIIYLATKDWFPPIIIMSLALIFGISAAKKPRTLEYVITADGINVGGKSFTFDAFKSFTIQQEGPIQSILLLPAKRWMPTLSLYFAPDDGERITNGLGAFVPFEELKTGLVDNFLHKIKF